MSELNRFLIFLQEEKMEGQRSMMKSTCLTILETPGQTRKGTLPGRCRCRGVGMQLLLCLISLSFVFDDLEMSFTQLDYDNFAPQSVK